MTHSPHPSFPTPTARRFRPRLEALDDRITPAVAFAAQQALTVGANPRAVAVADFNNDGRPDLVTANANDDTVSVLFNTTPAGTAAPTFAAQQTLAVGDMPISVAVGDINGDGRVDIVTANRGSYSLSVLLNTTTAGAAAPSFAPEVSLVSLNQVGAVALADFNGDGRVDIATASSQIAIMLNTTPIGSAVPTFDAAQQVASFINYWTMRVSDINGDGRPDLIYSISSSLNRFPPVFYTNYGAVQLNATAPGSSTVAFATAKVGAAAPVPSIYPIEYSVTAGDFDGDGRPDLVATDGETRSTMNGVFVGRNTTANGSGTASFGASKQFIPAAEVTIGTGGAPSGEAVVGDFDGDGRLDIAVVGVGNVLSILPNTTTAFDPNIHFGAGPAFAVGTSPVGLAVADFNGDGRPDLVTTNTGDGTVSILANATPNPAVAGNLVGQFGDAGVWQLNRLSGTWSQLTPSNADALAAAPNGNVVASFGDLGVWYYQPTTGWYLINGHRAKAVGIDGLGNVVASFEGFGTAAYRLADGWSVPLTSVAADRLAVNANGQLAAHFPNHGLYTYSAAAGWRFLHGYPITALALGENGDVAVSFVGYGVNVWRPTTDWVRLNDADATSLAMNGNGAVVAGFAGGGVGKYLPATNTWQTLHSGTPAVSVAMDLYGNVFATLGGFGVYEFNPLTGWRLRTTSAAGLLGLG